MISTVLVVRDAARIGTAEARDLLTQIDAGTPALIVGGPLLSNRSVRLGSETISLGEARRRFSQVEMTHEALGPKAGWREGAWSQAPGPDTPKGGYARATPEGGRRFATGGPLVQWETHYLNITPYTPGDNLVVMEMRSAYPDAQISLELVDKARVRWFATIDLGTNWHRAVLSPADFVPQGRITRTMKPAEIVRMGIGVSEQFTPRMSRRRSSVEVRRLGSVRNPFPPDMIGLPADFPQITVEGLWPVYKVWEKNGCLAFFDRNDGAGYGRGNIWRQKYVGNEHEMILLERRRGRPERCVALFGYTKPEHLRGVGVAERIERTRVLLDSGAILFEGGSDQFCYFAGETAKIGATWRGKARKVSLEIADRKGVSLARRDFTGEALATGRVEFAWAVPPAAEGSVWRVTATLDDGADAISHEFALAKTTPDPRADFITAHGGDFWLKGRKWYSACINFWPLYSAATERLDYWGTWQHNGYYAPNLVRKDLANFKRLGGNSISIQYGGTGCGRNVRDLYRICRELGIRVNQSLAAASPFDRSPRQQQDLKAYFDETGAAGDATVFAYDTVWEPGNYVFRESSRGQGAGFGRAMWNRDWQNWVVEQFGSIERATKVWGVDPGRDEKGLLKSPPQVAFVGRETPEKWRRIMAAYRRFMDNLTARKWCVLKRELAALAPNQLQSFRQGNTLPHDFALTGPMRHIDFVMPEGYSFADTDEDETAIGWITRYVDAYSRRKPILWSEFGRNAWNAKRQQVDAHVLASCTHYSERFYRAGLKAGANGFSPWWFPGGYRVDERSDYGYMGPDGVAREPLAKFAEWAPAMVREREKPNDAPTRTFDRDANPGGYYAAAFVMRLPAEAMTIAGADLSSVTAPALALGDMPLEGEMPLKYLDSDFDLLECVPAPNGALRVRAKMGNPGPATWKAASVGMGGVSLVAFDPRTGRALASAPLARDVERLDATDDIALVVPPSGLAQVAFRLEAAGRFRFGEKRIWRRNQ